MIKLSQPDASFEHTLSQCLLGITGNADLAEKLRQEKQLLLDKETGYLAAARCGELYTFQANNSESLHPLSLTKVEMIKLYEQYFRDKSKPARAIYNQIMSTANEKCPSCGGIGKPKNLDHYLPKKFFSQFSVFPPNLVPLCRDCNMGEKGDSYALIAEEQLIHPYLDKPCFFEQQWIIARYDGDGFTEPGTIIYEANPPLSWAAVDKQRAINHFNTFDLASAYTSKAGELLPILLSQIDSLKKMLTNEAIQQSIILEGINKSPFVNHWSGILYQALGEWLDSE